MINDVKNLKESGGASIEELREFLKSLKSRNPQEVIGIVKTSLLIQSLVLSCLMTIAFMAIFTVGPYMIYGPDKPSAPTPKATVAVAPAQGESSSSNSSATSAPTEKATTGAPDAEKAAKVMGLDETKPADPKKNPLDKPDLDKLLDGL